MRYLSVPTLFLGMLFLAGCDADGVTPPEATSLDVEPARYAMGASAPVHQELAAIRRATARFHDPAVAMGVGYEMDECISAEDLGAPAELGAMGYHFVNGGLIDDVFDPLHPEVLVYEQRGNALHLVAVEYLFVGEVSPEFADEVHFHEFPLPIADYALHAWVWKVNPAGMFADFNPNVSCPAD